MRAITIILLCLIQLGCATIASDSLRTEPPNIRIYDFNLQITLNKLEIFLKEDKIPIQSINRNKGTAICQRIQIELDEFKRLTSLPERSDAGGFKQPWLWARCRQQYYLKSIGHNQTEVKIRIHFEGYNASAARWITVISNGTKEKEILDKLQLYLVSPKDT